MKVSTLWLVLVLLLSHGPALGDVYKRQPPLSVAHKTRTYSPNRIPYPLKRVDWDPNGERNTQNRGTPKYARISWDEACDLIAAEIKRIQEEAGPFSILAQLSLIHI